MLRILAFVILLFSTLFLPFWFSVLLALAAMIYFSKFWEGTVLFLFSDLLHGVSEAKTFHIIFFSFILSVLVLIIIEFLKKKFKFYPKRN